jgi:uncharacterized repeat protein (TIGR03803 family)
MKIVRFVVALAVVLMLSCLFAGGVHAGVLTTLHKFNYSDGQAPEATLTPDGSGNLLGTAAFGGTYGAGTLFELTPDGNVSPIAFFDNTNGANPYGRLMLSGGVVYGTAQNGGPFSHGTVFKIVSNALVVLAALTNSTTDGAFPHGGLADGLDNEFFGTAAGGGAHGVGALFKLYFTDGSETPLVSFDTVNGFAPEGGLVLNPANGYFYGTTSGGGTNGGFGTVFKVSYTGIFNSIYSFDQTNGANPWATLTLGANGVLYGATAGGGTNGYGTIFSVSNDVVRTVAEFAGTNGASPYAELTAAADGTLYGTTRDGGANSRGTIFEVTTNGTLLSLFSFNYGNGAAPYGGLVFGGDGNLYGTTSDGGLGNGTVFRFILNPPAPEFLSVTKTNANTLLTWSAVSGGNYQLQYKTNLLQASWSNLGLAVMATNSTMLASDFAPPDAQRFYRAVLLQP